MGNALPVEDTTSTANVDFYMNQRPCIPDGLLIDDIHGEWFGDWDLLESKHGYIQWLFPIREVGMNGQAQPLTKNEAEIFRNTPDIKGRIIKSYKLMLDFYGLVLIDEQKGQVARNPETYRQRYAHLNSSFHNYLRITRIMKCLGLVGFEHYKLMFLRHWLLEIYKNNLVPHVADSLIKYWLPTLRRPEELAFLDRLVHTASGGRRTVNREGRDGHGDEQGENWATQLYPSDYTFDLASSCLTTNDVITAPYRGVGCKADKKLMHSVVVVGGGIVGLAVLRSLATRNVDCVLLEKSNDIVSGASSGNSGIFHTGFDEPPNSMEAKCIQESWRQLHRIFKELGNDVIPHDTCGALVVAWNQTDLDKLNDVLELARKNNVEAHMVDREQLLEMEPNLNKRALGAVHVPGETLMHPWMLPAFYLHQALSAGAILRTSCQVIGGYYAEEGERHWELKCKCGDQEELIKARIVINCAGNYGDIVENLCDGGSRTSDFIITPRKGQFAVLEKGAASDVRFIILSVPTDRTKGVLVSRTIFGNVIIGPTAEDQRDREEATIDQQIIEQIFQSGTEMIPSLQQRHIVGTYAGLRPASQYRDYQIGASRGWITVGGIRSTGLSASMGIGEEVWRLYKKESGDKDRDMRIYPHSVESVTWKGDDLIVKVNGRESIVLHKLVKIGMKDL